MKGLSLTRANIMHLMVPMIVVFAFMVAVSDSSGQTNRRRSTPIPAPTATPASSEPLVISRADEFPDENSRAIPPDPNEVRPTVGADNAGVVSLQDLGNRIKNLEAARGPAAGDPDAKPKRLLLNLDILTRAEQRSEGLRKQLFEMIEKENAVKTKIDTLEFEMRPESVDRSMAFVGSLRPEEVRASRKKSLEAERANLQSLLTEIQKNRVSLEASLLKSDALVEKLRSRFEKEIDTALEEDPAKPEN